MARSVKRQGTLSAAQLRRVRTHRCGPADNLVQSVSNAEYSALLFCVGEGDRGMKSGCWQRIEPHGTPDWPAEYV